ncbi:hypothetical protein DTO013E5_8110 [Penicillium roqueforti]|uniref:Genomic scaffold, ProqFM164S02 n=1 Tax=Penicillium roqueforti (strain FM164) TaxID=1365484 RepID=W6Q0L1_PENRF|nr:uncharacterized protein LCP9604111_4671 [Penicillium roqueforti]CDM30083.1 unnamed protein product [Penicillium roqueforti FM164]KAF9248955.1 hypothetical protein LCP9604111_4671 [Penicillium roqueforti]KAI1831844.1 hypothetical protein CBS147337_7290 [Penicillium roqueforti]KAI2670069.1 hypothetical protein CBS147355_9482 [Penicillium roqueforti]KAI2677677.1 hypothetical protein LCP963914a_7969 [Penicillium roqueforti]
MPFSVTAFNRDTGFVIVPSTDPTAWQQFRHRPCLFLARKLSAWRPANRPDLPEKPITVVCIANAHRQRPVIPHGDILIYAGGLAADGSLTELQATLDWLRSQPHYTKIVVAGRSDRYLNVFKKGGDRWRYGYHNAAQWSDIIYLEHEHVTVTAQNGRQLQIFGSPYSPKTVPFPAFQYPETDNIWDQIPGSVDILITHTPPYTHRDSLQGCWHLLERLWRDPPRLHVFGCSLENYGSELLHYDALQEAMERIEAAGGGFVNLLKVLKALVQSFFRPSIKAKTALVNACIEGGLWHPGRQPITVVI